MQEMDLVPLAKTGRLKRVVVDSREACLAEAGELRRLLSEHREAQGNQDEWLPELGQLVTQDGVMTARSEDDVVIL